MKSLLFLLFSIEFSRTFPNRPDPLSFSPLCRYGGAYDDLFGKCVKNMFATTYSQAVETCSLLGGSLPCVHNSQENDEIAVMHTDIGCSQFTAEAIWLGNGSPSCKSTYTNWDAHNNLDSGCVIQYSNMGNTWFRDDCELDTAFICLYNTFNVCPPDWIFFQGHCYIMSTSPNSQDGFNFNTAAAYCEGRYNAIIPKSDLASVLSADENDFIISMARTIKPNGKGYIYIGLTTKDWVTFTWLDGSPFNYTNWDYFEPFANPNQFCVKMSVYDNFGNLGTWSTVDCSTEFEPTLICKAPAPK